MKLALIGFGVVGQGLAALLEEQGAWLAAEQGFSAEIVAVATLRRGSLYHPDGLDLGQLRSAISAGHLDQYPEQVGLQRGLSPLEIIQNSNADVVVELSHTNLETGQPAIDHCRAAFASGKHVVTANKGPVALAYHDLRQQAADAGLQFLFESTVMAGTPTIRLGMEALAGCRITAAQGILNGTTNYMLTQMESGMSYEEAFAQADALGYLEADPSADVGGWDAASKVLILAAALFGVQLRLEDLNVSGIEAITLEDVQAAAAAGERWKLIAEVTPEGGSVQARRISLTDPLAGVGGSVNAVSYTTETLGTVTLIGPGAGASQTASGVLADLLAIHRIRA